MISAFLPFDEILENVSDDTGYENLRPYEEKIRRFILRAEMQLGYSGALVFKKVPYGKILATDTSVLLPSDMIEFYGFSDSKGSLQKSDYSLSKTRMFFRKKQAREDFTIYYFGLLCDGLGNPCTVRSHSEALTAFIIWKLFGAKVFLDPARHSRKVAQSYEQDWKDYRDASIGDDVFPVGEEEWNEISMIFNASSYALQCMPIYDDMEKAFALETKIECVIEKKQEDMYVYSWQYGSTTDGIDGGPAVNQQYLVENTQKSALKDFLQGKTIPYIKIGRIAFAVENGIADEYRIFDVLNHDITNVVFDKYYNETLKLDVFISKVFYSYSNMFFKFEKA